jgi:hypothetical protein
MGDDSKIPVISAKKLLYSEFGLAAFLCLTYLLFFCGYPLLGGITVTGAILVSFYICHENEWKEGLGENLIGLLDVMTLLFIVGSFILWVLSIFVLWFILGSLSYGDDIHLGSWGEIYAILLIPGALILLSSRVDDRFQEEQGVILLANEKLEKERRTRIRQAEEEQTSQLKKGLRCKAKQSKDASIIFKLKSKLPTPLPDGLSLKIEMEDITNDDSAELPILGLDASLQFPDSEKFRYTVQEIKHLADEPDRWTTMVEVFFSQLSFAYSQKRRVKTTFTFRREEGLEKPFQFEVSDQITINLEQPGYLESLDFPYLREKEALRLALYVASVDGKTVSSELDLIKEYGSRIAKVDHPQEIIQKAIKKDVNACLRIAGEMIQNGDQEELFEEILSDLQERSEKAALYDVYNWCLKIVKADGVIHPEEMAALTRIRNEFKLDEEKAKKMRDRALAGLHIFEFQDDSNADKLLGIETSMSKEGIRTLLNAEFRTWNGRVNHEDEDTRTEAATRLAMIAAARTRHIKL